MGFWRELKARVLGENEPAAAAQAPTTQLAKMKALSLPSSYREPGFQIAGTFKTVPQFEGTLFSLDLGMFSLPAMLVRQVLRNTRIRGLTNVRLAGLVGTESRWTPGRDNAAGRRAAKAIVEDWPLIASSAQRKQLHEWGMWMGVGFAQKHWYLSSSGRWIPRLQVYDPRWAWWDWSTSSYRLQTRDGGVVEVPSPAFNAPRDSTPGLWVVHEPFGTYSFQNGIIHAAWYQYLTHQVATRGASRGCEKFGLEIIKAIVPVGSGDQHQKDVDRFVSLFRRLGSEGVIPCVDRGIEGKFDASFLEPSGQGHQIIQATRQAAVIDLAVLILGNPATTDSSATTFASANVGNDVRADIREDDASSDRHTHDQQVLREWALVNFGDPDLAPCRVDETDPPAINLAAAQTLQLVATAIVQLVKVLPGLDVQQLASRFRIPLLPGAKVVPAPPVDPATGGSPVAPDVNAQERSIAAMTRQINALARTDRAAAQRALEGWLVELTGTGERTT